MEHVNNNLVYSSNSFSDNEKLNQISINFIKELRNLPKYEDFNEVIKMQRVALDRDKVQQKYIVKYEELERTTSNELKKINQEIVTLKAPNDTKPDIQSKTYAETLRSNAKKDFELRPTNIHLRLQNALENGKHEYIFEVKDLYLNSKDVTDLERHTVKNFIDELETLLGLTELENRKDQLEGELVEVRKYIETFEESPEKLEAMINMNVRVYKIMYENGELEGKSILMSDLD